jgi:hypothetical protein
VNLDQLNTDFDTMGNACDPDDDNDNLADNFDNCPVKGNPSQANWDADTMGDACDDGDGDGYFDDAEWHVGTHPAVKCGIDGWPADLYVTGLSFNKVTLQDFTSFAVPVRHLNTSVGDPGYSVRWDLVPGRSIQAKDISLQDLTSIPLSRPPMLNGANPLNQSCPP